MNIADIGLFERLLERPNRKVVASCSVSNSAASKLMLDYEKALQSLHLCKKYIKDMQKVEDESYVPSSMVASLYQLKEKCEDELSAIEEQLVSQVTSEPLDTWDRKVFTKLSSDSREALRDVLEDDVIRRAMEMQAEALEEIGASGDMAEGGEYAEEPEQPKQKVAETKVEKKAEVSKDKKAEDDSYGLDVSSSEG